MTREEFNDLATAEMARLQAANARLERSASELRAALILAGKEILKLNFGKRDNATLAILRRVLRESRAMAKKGGA